MPLLIYYLNRPATFTGNSQNVCGHALQVITALSRPRTTESITRKFGRSRGNVNMVPNSTATSEFEPPPTEEDSKQVLRDEEERLVIYGFRKHTLRSHLVNFLSVLSLGLLSLLFHWYPTLKLQATHSKCSLEKAEKVLVTDEYQKKYKSYYVEDVKELSFSNTNDGGKPLGVYLGDGYFKESLVLRAVWCKKLCYIWDEHKKKFMQVVGLDKGRKCFEFHQIGGYSKEQQLLKLITYGENEINVPVHTIATLLVLEALTPFYIFQVFSLIVWFAEFYYYYTVAIIIMSVFGITSSVIQTRRNQKSLQKSVHTSAFVLVSRNGAFLEIPSSDLVPGDVIEIPKQGCTMQCDAVLLTGSCIVNESMLTGESVPVTKTPLPKSNTPYDVKEDSFHTLFCGTSVIQTRTRDEKILAVVLRTGFLTTKGELVRSILYPPPSDFKFDQDSYKFIGILTGIALLGCTYTIVAKSGRSIAVGDIIIKALDLITIVVPPALPAAMTMGKLYALGRLKKHQIFCMNSRVINVSGSIDCICFDKTGTLTEDGLDMWGVVPVENNILQGPRSAADLPPTSTLVTGMATCHSITELDGELLGDPLDVKVFESTGWNLKEDEQRRVFPSIDHQVEIIRQFQFSSSLQRMSVITRTGPSLEVFCKGSPEKIMSFSKPETVPVNISNKLREFTEKGYRVIALATKALDEDVLERSKAESDLEFVGLIILENRLKPQTPGVITVLKKARIKTVMITGDNIQTALSVARECGIVDNHEMVIDVDCERKGLSFNVLDCNMMNEKPKWDENLLEKGLALQYCYAMTGNTWSFVKEHYPDKIPELVSKGAVFARMSGHQKQQLVQELQQLGYYVAMCGDGANDCGALKAAHVGISLSEEESSVASPFTSKTPDISCVLKVVREGRAALATSLGIFKFMVCYSLAQFTSVVILYGIDSNLTSLEFLFIDICLIIHFTSFFGKTEAYDGPLNKSRPSTSLLGLTSISSILFQMFFVIVFQIFSYKLVQTYSWFEPFHFDSNNSTFYTCYENYAVYCASILQYIIMAVAFSKGKPFRKPFYTNRVFLFSLILMTLICCYITLYSAQWLAWLLELLVPPRLDFGFVILALALANLICSLIAEDVVVEYFLNRKLAPKLKNLLKSQKKFLGDVESLTLQSKLKSETTVVVKNEVRKSMIAEGIVNHAFLNDQEEITKL